MIAVQFTEEMVGHVAFGARDCETGAAQGRRSSTDLLFHLTIAVADIRAFVTDPMHPATVTGWVTCSGLAGGRMPVERGTFNLFAPGSSPKRSSMRYCLWIRDDAGRPLTLVGRKDIGDDPGFDVWADTTTLDTALVDGHVEEPESAYDTSELATSDGGPRIRARGILVITPKSFARQLTTFRGTPEGLVRFGWLFGSTLWTRYRGIAPARVRAAA